jgi:hypothetical protein
MHEQQYVVLLHPTRIKAKVRETTTKNFIGSMSQLSLHHRQAN